MRVSPLEGHRIWASSYDAGDNPLLALERRSMKKLLHSIKPSTAIDVGCGSGRWLLRLQKAGVNVIGVDFCEEMLAEARRHPSLRGRLALGRRRGSFRYARQRQTLCFVRWLWVTSPI